MQTVPDSQAGQTAVCTNCHQSFPVPSLMQPVREPAAAAATPAQTSSAYPKGNPATDPGSEIFTIAMDAAQQEARSKSAPVTPPVPPRREKPEPAPGPLPTRDKLNAAAMPSASDYVHHYTLMIRPAAVALVAPIALLLVVVFWFFSWTGAYPGGHAVYTQSGLQTTYRGFTVNPVGEKVFGYQSKIAENMHWNGLMFLYVVLSLAALALVLAPMVTSSGAPHLPPFLERIWPWRWLLSLVLATLALLVLIAQSGLGFGLENAVDAMVQEKVAAEKLPSATPEEQQIVELNEGKYAGSLNVHRTWWWRLALLAQLASVLGLAGEWLLHRRTNQLAARADFHW